MKGEIWKPVRNYEGLYEVSNMGRVKSLERTVWCGLNGGCYRAIPEKILEGYDDGHGYLQVELYKDGKGKWCSINRLVAQAFLENPQNLPEVNHKDENKKNNRVENLEWCSKLYNVNYGTRNKKISEKLKGRKHSEEHNKKVAEKLRGRKQTEESVKKRSKPVFSVDKESGLIMWWESAKEASRQTGINQSNITQCCKGKVKSAGGHTWFYADED